MSINSIIERVDYDDLAVKSISARCGNPEIANSMDYVGMLTRCNKEHPPETYVLYLGGRPVGFFSIDFRKSGLRLYAIAVEPQDGRKGYGTFMLKDIKRRAMKARLNKITLKTQDVALRFYLKNGGKVVSRKGRNFEVNIRV